MFTRRHELAGQVKKLEEQKINLEKQLKALSRQMKVGCCFGGSSFIHSFNTPKKDRMTHYRKAEHSNFRVALSSVFLLPTMCLVPRGPPL